MNTAYKSNERYDRYVTYIHTCMVTRSKWIHNNNVNRSINNNIYIYLHNNKNQKQKKIFIYHQATCDDSNSTYVITNG